jgi:hypothetical protein
MLEEWSLFDHVFFLMSRWSLVICVTFAFSAVAVAAAFVLPRKASGEGLLQVGTVLTFGSVEDPREIVARINSISFKRGLMNKYPEKIPDIITQFKIRSQVVGSTGLVRIRTVGKSEEQAKDLVLFAANEVIELHKPKFKTKRDIFQTKYETLKKEIEFLQEQVSSPRIETDEAVSMMMTAVERSRQWERLSKLRRDLSNYEAELKPVLARETKLVENPASLIISKRRKIVLFGSFSGLLMSIILAYLFEFSRQRKEGLAGTA